MQTGDAAPTPAQQHFFMGEALRLARRGLGWTSPNPMVGAVLVRKGKIIGQGWHRRAGEPHAEIEAMLDAGVRGEQAAGATLYITLEPCSTHGRTPPCTETIIRERIAQVVFGAIDPNPAHAGRARKILQRAGIEVFSGVRAEEATRLNEAFNYWIVHRRPWVTVKAALSADGKIATASGESKWITGVPARAWGMKLRQAADAILVGVNTVLQDNPQLTVRRGLQTSRKRLRRIILDTRARTPLSAQVITGGGPELTTIVTSDLAPAKRRSELAARVNVLAAPCKSGRIDLNWLLAHLGSEAVTNLLVEGGSAVNSSFLFGGLAHRIAFFYAPKIIGGQATPGAVGGRGARRLVDVLQVEAVEWRRLGVDFLLTGRVIAPQAPLKVR